MHDLGPRTAEKQKWEAVSILPYGKDIETLFSALNLGGCFFKAWLSQI